MMLQFIGAMLGLPDSAEPAQIEAAQREFFRLAHPRGNRPQPHAAPDSPPVYLNYGRWLVDCPCGSGARITPAGTAYCFDCGRIMTVAVPAAEALVLAAEMFQHTDPDQCNWDPRRDGPLSSDVRA